MKNKTGLYKIALSAGLIAFLTIIGFSIISCGEPGLKIDPAANRVSYVSGANELIIEKSPNRSAFSPQTGDLYKLLNGAIQISWGTVNIAGSTFNFTPADNAAAQGATSFTATKGTVSGSEGLTISGGSVTGINGAVTITPMVWGPAGNWAGSVTLFNGTKENVDLEVKGTSVSGTWSLNTGDSGTYTAVGNTFAVYDGGLLTANAKLINNNIIEVVFTKDSYFTGKSTFTRKP